MKRRHYIVLFHLFHTVTVNVFALNKQVECDIVTREFSAPIEIVQTPGIDRLLANYRQFQAPHNHNYQKLQFRGVEGKDVYNPTSPFKIDDQRVIAARVESSDSETDSRIVFFSKKDGHWFPVPGIQPLPLQDPFHSTIQNLHVIGGVETYPENGGLGYKTVFYRGTSLGNLERFAAGPPKMKDIRIVDVNGRLVVLTRPQGKIPGTNFDAGPGRIGFMYIDKLEDLNKTSSDGNSILYGAKIIQGLFQEGEWGGVNQAIAQSDGRIRLVMHIARFDENGGKHYYAASSILDPVTGVILDYKILAERAHLIGGLQGKSKWEKHPDIIFAGGIEDNTLYLGAGDAESHTVGLGKQ